MPLLEVVLTVVAAVNTALLLLLLWRVWNGRATSSVGSLTNFEPASDRAERAVREEVARGREEAAAQARQGRDEMRASLKEFAEAVLRRIIEIAKLQKGQFDTFSTQVATAFGGNDRKLDSLRDGVDRKLTGFIADTQADATRGRTEVRGSLQSSADALLTRMAEIATLQKQQLDTFANNLQVLTQTNSGRLDQMRDTIEARLKAVQEDNAVKLEQMRLTVDEKLQATLEQRLGESFKLVSERLEQVHRGLGEMQVLAAGVGDLKKVLTNIKTRGGWGEVQLGNLLEQILTAEQYGCNVCMNPTSSEIVEFAIKLPGRDGMGGACVWLPIDAKFPQEDYLRLIEAADAGDAAKVGEACKALEGRIKLEGHRIKDKYLCPPHTTDFAIMFLPTEGLYAEVLRRPGLCEMLQGQCRVVVAGPTTIAALLNSLQMGFRTLAIEKRSSEVWAVLGAIKLEFGKFGDAIKKVQKKLQEASNTMEGAATRTRAMKRALLKAEQVEPPSPSEAARLLGISPDDEDEDGAADLLDDVKPHRR